MGTWLVPLLVTATLLLLVGNFCRKWIRVMNVLRTHCFKDVDWATVRFDTFHDGTTLVSWHTKSARLIGRCVIRDNHPSTPSYTEDCATGR